MNETQSPLSGNSRTKFLIQYAVVAYLFSWAIEIPLALKAQGLLSANIPFSIHYLAAFGPFVAAIFLTRKEYGREGLRELFGRILKWRVEPLWWIVALSPLLLFLSAVVVLGTVSGTWFDLGALGRVDFLPDLGIASMILWLATFGMGEEVGWRGYFLPRLQTNRSALSATAILWLVWAAWHIPSFFYLQTVSGIGSLVGFLIGMFSGALVLTWLYNSGRGSVLLVAVWHGLFDYVTACTECKTGVIAAVVSTLVMVWAVVVVVVFKPENLSRRKKQTIKSPGA